MRAIGLLFLFLTIASAADNAQLKPDISDEAQEVGRLLLGHEGGFFMHIVTAADLTERTMDDGKAAKLQGGCCKLIDANLTPEDQKALLAFYHTDAGKRILAAMPVIEAGCLQVVNDVSKDVKAGQPH